MKKLSSNIIINLVLLGIFIIILAYASIRYGPFFTRLTSQPEMFRQYILAYGSDGVLTFLLVQMMQVIIAVIPGELVQVAGGYIYGVWLGSLYSLAGITLGSVIVLYIGRFLGYPLLKNFISPSRFERFSFFINSPRAELIACVLFLIPGMPKDILTYLAGITPMQPLRFIVIIAAARFPGILISSFIGASIDAGQYFEVAVATGVAVALFLLGFLYKDRIINKIQTKFANENSRK
ncbi:MAG: VTT domain-containing protein [Syntrophomonadaceae bacterium]|nr:VTT domain-containing protein [Syntrophomonadaceae bacterium]